MKICRATLFLSLLLILPCAVVSISAQTGNPNLQSNANKNSSETKSDDPMSDRPFEEMIARREIKSLEEAHKENLERAKETAQLSAQLRDAFVNNKTLGRDEVKKLERMEKLARRIRKEAGGSDDNDVNPENIPKSLDTAISRLADASEDLRKSVENTPRQVVSTTVIERANEMLDIIRYLRTNAH